MSCALFPVNVRLLQARGVHHTWRQREQDIHVTCPHCAGTMVIHESKPWHHCPGVTCPAHRFTFTEIMAEMPAVRAEVAQ